MKNMELASSQIRSSGSGRSSVRVLTARQLQLSDYLRGAFDAAMTKSQNQYIGETVKKESPRLLNFIRKHIPDTNDAEDILQDVFYQLIESSRLMRPIEEVTSWLFTVARNKITDRFRKKRPESLEKQLTYRHEEDGEMLNISDILPSTDASADTRMLRAAIMEELEEALDALPKDQRDVFMMHEIEGKSFNEISEITGVSINTLLSRKRYAVLFLRARLKELYKELLNN